ARKNLSGDDDQGFLGRAIPGVLVDHDIAQSGFARYQLGDFLDLLDDDRLRHLRMIRVALPQMQPPDHQPDGTRQEYADERQQERPRPEFSRHGVLLSEFHIRFTIIVPVLRDSAISLIKLVLMLLLRSSDALLRRE